MNIDQFEELVESRRSVRSFRPDPIPEDLMRRLLNAARWAPSGYNLQPTHFIVVTRSDLKKNLRRACLDQRQVSEAPADVVFTGDRRVVENNLERMIAMERAAGAINEKYEAVLRRVIPLAFSHRPLGLGWLLKAALPLARIGTAIPSLPAVQKRYWLTKQVLLAAMNFMLAARAAGLSTVPMEGFDEGRVRRALKIPASHIVPLIVPVGYAEDTKIEKSRLPLEGMVHWEGW